MSENVIDQAVIGDGEGREMRIDSRVSRTAAAQAVAHRGHLYVMQATDGRIKIGRSGNPNKRRRDLETSSGMKIALIATFKGRGSEEGAIHALLHEYRRIGEWFDDDVIGKFIANGRGSASAQP